MGDDGLQYGSPSPYMGFALIIYLMLKEANMQLVEEGGCARFGMDDENMLGPRETIFQMLADLAVLLNEKVECEVVMWKC
jgi:hypothetical protein